MLVECGYVRAVAQDGQEWKEWTFLPSFSRIASIGHPREIVASYAALHGPAAEREARYILACLCEQDDPAPLLGWIDDAGDHAGLMSPAEQVLIARHLMQHGIVGRARPGAGGDGKYSDRFDAAEYIAAARVHLGLSGADAEALSMTEFQTMLDMRFPERTEKRDMPTREEYEETMRMFNERRASRG